MQEYKTFIKEVYHKLPSKYEGEHTHKNYHSAILACMDSLYIQTSKFDMKVKRLEIGKETHFFIDNELFAKVYPAY
jgi:carbonic anhydrase